MRKRSVLITIGIILVFAMAVILTSQSILSAQECRIIRIMEGKGATGKRLGIDPPVTTITKGTCVVWINWVPQQEIQIVFKEDGKKCADNTEAPGGFKQTPDNCFLTDFIKLGGTSSLRFKEAGTYNYKVVVSDKSIGQSPLGVGFGPIEGEGQIVVK